MGCGLGYSYHEHTIIMNITVTTVISFLYMHIFPYVVEHSNI